MTSYAPLLAKEKHTQWNPDLIYFNNTEVKPTVNYEVQKLFGNNSGNEYLPVNIKLSNSDEAVSKRFNVKAIPTMILVNQAGQEVYRWLDYQKQESFLLLTFLKARGDLD